MNPFIALFENPIAVLTAFAYAILLLALTLWTIAAFTNLAGRAWHHAVWLGNAWEWRGNAQEYGPEWSRVLPPKPVLNHATVFLGYVGLSVFLVAIDVWAIAAVIYVLT